MKRAILWFLLGSVMAGLVAGYFSCRTRWAGDGTSTRPDVAASVDYIRQIGELSVMRASVKEIVTSKVGEPGWFTTQGKLAIICHFDITYTYDLRKARIAAGSRDDGTRYCLIHLPRHEFVVSTKDIRFYDEQDGTWLGFARRTPPDARTLALDAARQEAEKQAKTFMTDMEGEIQNSAQATLGQIARAFGFTEITFEFEK
jgi:hypothetical protein